jgi:hypothetical protein
MASLLSLDHFATLFQTGFFVNVAYLVIRMKLGSPVADYVKIERDVRVRLQPLSSEEVKSAKSRLIRDMRSSEKLLRFFLRLASVSQYVALIVSFVLLLMAAFSATKLAQEELAGFLLLIFTPVPLSLLTFAGLSYFYLGQLERDIMKVAQAANIVEDIKTANSGAERTVRIKNAIEHLETTLGSRR